MPNLVKTHFQYIIHHSMNTLSKLGGSQQGLKVMKFWLQVHTCQTTIQDL